MKNNNEIHTAKVLWFSVEKQYGFIQENGTDYFVHKNSLPPGTTLTMDDKIEFTPSLHNGKWQAINIKIL